MKLTKGTLAPALTGTSLSGKTVSLHEYAGRRVLLKFYRFASCPRATRPTSSSTSAARSSTPATAATTPTP
jgi:peroxiredoxin